MLKKINSKTVNINAVEITESPEWDNMHLIYPDNGSMPLCDVFKSYVYNLKYFIDNLINDINDMYRTEERTNYINKFIGLNKDNELLMTYIYERLY